jgi:pyrrolysine biosynthesis protein PylD
MSTMTRLIEDWIKNISDDIKEYEKELVEKTGFNLISLASNASNINIEYLLASIKESKIGVIPITSGQGIIGSFTNSVVAILRAMNFDAFVTADTDVAGIYEAHQRGAKIIFLADDKKFIAINLEKNTVVDNNFATAVGFVSAMEGAAGGDLKYKKVLLIGCGTVGKEILNELKRKDADVVTYDIDKNILKKSEKYGFKVLSGLDEMIKYKWIMDATSTGGWLKKDMLHPDVFIATPGVPISLDPEAYEYYKDRALHDYLPIGVAVMAAIACK